MKSYYFCCAIFCSFVTLLCAEELKAPGCLSKKEAVSLLDTTEDLLSKANDAYPTCKNQSECGGKLSSHYIEISKKLITNVRDNFPTCTSTGSKETKKESAKPEDCSDILASGRKESGVYTIWPRESCTVGNPLEVYCDMDTDYGGWTLIQRRGKFQAQQDFYLDWESYKNGFGNILEEFWLGNENIRVLCHKGCKIRFDLQAPNGTKGYAVYDNFNLTRNSYTLFVSHYSGNIGDCLQHHNYYPFSTKDKGVDTVTAVARHGAWWYSVNNYCTLNGIYQPGASDVNVVFWWNWISTNNLARVEMKVRPK